MFKSISASEFSNLVASGKAIDLIDVRTPIEYRAMHVECARNQPLDRLDPKAIQASRNGSANEPLYVVRSKQACEKFVASGVVNVINVEGGTLACVAAGLPVVRGKKVIPLNCQVQIVVGTLVVVGSVLAVWGHPYWAALPGVMGAGLVFSGLTDSCAMGAILAKMPWNQVSKSCTDSSNPSATCCTK